MQPKAAIAQQVIGGTSTSTPHSRCWTIQHDHCVFAFADGIGAAFDLAARKLLWTAETPPRPVHQPLPRRFTHDLTYSPRAYPSFGLIVHLSEAKDGGLWIVARRLNTGDVAWDSCIALPAPERWTESEWLHEMLQTEELQASLAALADRIVVVVRRTSRRSSLSTPTDNFPMPPLDFGIHLFELDSSTGHVIHENIVRGAGVAFEDGKRFDGLAIVGRDICEYNWVEKHWRKVVELPNPVQAVLRRPTAIFAAFADGRTPCLATIDPCAQLISNIARLPRNQSKIRTLTLTPLPEGGLLRVNETRLARFDEFARERFEIRVRPHVYDVALTESHTLLVGTDGRGTNCYAFDDLSGALIHHYAKSGSPHFSPCAGQWLAATGDANLLFVSPDGSRWTRVPCERGFTACGVVDNLVWSMPWIGNSDGLALNLRYLEAGCPADGCSRRQAQSVQREYVATGGKSE